MTQHEPNYLIEHRDGWKVEMYLSRQFRARLNNHNSEIRASARMEICRRFRKACEAQMKGDPSVSLSPPPTWVDWRHLQLTLQSSPEAEQALSPVRAGGQCCPDDNCVVCDIGNHGFCRNGCTIR